MQGRRGKGKTNKEIDPSNRRPYTVDRVPCLSGRRRRPCPDCHFCQGCSQDRCRLCRVSKKPATKKLTMAEQIALYERINKKKGARKK